MKELCYTLLSDGSSDKALMPILTWLLRKYQVECAIQSNWADLRRLPKPPKTLLPRIISSLELYPCDRAISFSMSELYGEALAKILLINCPRVSRVVSECLGS